MPQQGSASIVHLGRPDTSPERSRGGTFATCRSAQRQPATLPPSRHDAPEPPRATALPHTNPTPAKQTRHIFVTGGVVSSLGKGLTSASIGMLLERRGL